MIWTQTKPPKSGYYWVYGDEPLHIPRILKFVEMNKPPAGGPWHPLQPETGPKATEGWKWFSGPIELPRHACTHPGKPVCFIADEYHCRDCGASVPDPTETPTLTHHSTP